jgi:hypothetical protein
VSVLGTWRYAHERHEVDEVFTALEKSCDGLGADQRERLSTTPAAGSVVDGVSGASDRV